MYYLESNPSEDFVKKTYQQLKNKMALIESSFPIWLKNQSGSKDRKRLKLKFAHEMNIKKINAQIKSLKYLLG